MQRASVFADGDLLVGPLGLRQTRFTHEGDHTAQLGIEAVQSFQVEVREPLRLELSLLDPAR